MSLKNTPDPMGGSLLDSTIILHGSELGDGGPHKTDRVLFVGRLVHNKGPDLALRADRERIDRLRNARADEDGDPLALEESFDDEGLALIAAVNLDERGRIASLHATLRKRNHLAHRS